MSPGCAHCYAERYRANADVKGAGPFGPTCRFHEGADLHSRSAGSEAAPRVRQLACRTCFTRAVTDLQIATDPRRDRDREPAAHVPGAHEAGQEDAATTSSATSMPRGFARRENLWLGVSVEDQERADERIPILLQSSGWPRLRFLSVEPLLGPVEILTMLQFEHVTETCDALHRWVPRWLAMPLTTSTRAAPRRYPLGDRRAARAAPKRAAVRASPGSGPSYDQCRAARTCRRS